MARNGERECYESRKNSIDGIWLNPKCFYNGNLVAKLGNKQVKRLFCKEVKPQAIGGRNGWLLTGNAEDEEIVLSHIERVWLQMQHLQSSDCK